MDDCMVSVICLCYNHANFIESTLKGFVSQKTSFKYEVLIHDDASTDGSAQIIAKYQEMYPEIIKPVYQNVNQYSQGIPISKTFLLPLIKGKYLAFCEGDDYWCDDNKLQMQVDFLETHRDFVACTHNSFFYNFDTGEKKIYYSESDSELFIEDVIIGGGTKYQTSSLMYRTVFFYDQPEWMRMINRVGDYPLSIYLTISGRVMYFGNVMSVYKSNVPNSYTRKTREDVNIAYRVYSDTIKNAICR